MPRGNVNVRIDADSKPLKRELGQAERHLHGFSKSASKLAALGGVSVGVAGLAAAVSSVVSASIEAEKSQAKLDAQLKTIGKSSDAVKGKIDKVVQAQSLMSGFDDEALTDSFTNIVRVTGNVTKSLDLNNLAMDLARAKNIDVAKAGEIVGKVAGGNTGVLSRYGLSIEKGATASEALAKLQERLGGQAKAYGKTQAGSIDRMNVAFENLREKLGNALAPAVSKAADTVAKFVTQMQDGTGAGGRFVDKLKEIWNTIKPTALAFADIGKKVAKFADKHPDVAKLAFQLAAVGLAVKGIKFASKISGLSTFLGAAKAGASAFRRIWVNAGTSAGSAASAKTAEALADNLPTSIKARGGRFRGAGKVLAGTVAAGMIAAIPVAFAGFLSALSSWLKNKLDPNDNSSNFGGGGNAPNAWDALKSLIPGVGGAIVGTNIPETGGAPRGATARMAGGGLRGAAAGAADWLGRQGYRPTSTYRSDSDTYHGTGQAVDYGTSLNNLNKLANVVWPFRSQFEELFIPTWAPHGGLYHNGVKFSSPNLQAHHQDHIHIADTGGSFSASVGASGGRNPPGKRGTFVRGKGSWFGGPRDGMDRGQTALGVTTATPGCAIRPGADWHSGQPFLGGYWRITAPNGEVAVLQQTDLGPNQTTGRRIDITYSALDRFGYTESTFPTDGQFRAYYLGPRSTTSGAKPKTKKLLPTAHIKVGGQNWELPATDAKGRRWQRGMISKIYHAAGVRRGVNASRGDRIGTGFDNRYTLATLTPLKGDDFATATAGRDYWQTKVRQYQHGLSHGDRRVTGEMLTGAIAKRDEFQGYMDASNPFFGSDIGGALTGGTESSGGGASLNDVLAELKALNAGKDRVLATTGGKVIEGLIHEMASMGIGTSFNLSNQAGGRGAGLHASY